MTKADGIIEASVQEISDDSVTYREFGSQDGPVFRIPAQKLVAVRLQNGTEKVFSRAAASTGGPLMFKHGDVRTSEGVKLSYRELQDILPPDLYGSARGGMRMRNVGKGLTIAGSCVCGVALLFSVMEGVYGDGSFLMAGTATAVIGVPLLGAGVPLFCVGKNRAKRAVSEYNAGCGYRYPDVSFNVGSTANGFGVYLSF